MLGVLRVCSVVTFVFSVLISRKVCSSGKFSGCEMFVCMLAPVPWHCESDSNDVKRLCLKWHLQGK